MLWEDLRLVLLPCAELKADEQHPTEGQPAEDNTPLSKDEEIEEVTADDYFIKNAEASSMHTMCRFFKMC